MSRIDIAVPANASPATATSAKGPQGPGDTKLDDVFQKLIKKLNGELAKGKNDRNDKDASVAEETKSDAKKPLKSTGHKTAVRDDLDRGETPPDRDETGTESLDPGTKVEADARTRPPTLPELLQSLPINAKVEKPATAADPQTRQAAPVAANVRKAGADAKEGGALDKIDGSARDPFAALTSLLAKESIGNDAEPVSPELPVKSPKFTLVARETHFEPVVRTLPAQQVANIIVSNIAATAPDAGEVVTTGAPASPEIESLSLRTPSEGPLKILHIKLEPHELGEVTVKMRLVGGSLEVRLEASRAETADLLTRDKDMLHKLLRAPGYSPDVVTIQAVGESSSSQSTSNQTGQNGSSAQNPSPFQGGETSDNRRQGDETAPAHEHLSSSENAHQDPASSADGNLYL